jgi:hypothetical protein
VYLLINLLDGFYASGSWDKTFKIWNTNNECVNTIYEDNWVCSLLLLPEGNIASGKKLLRYGNVIMAIKIYNVLIP